LGLTHWERARAEADAAGVTLRPLTTLGDADAVLRVMEATWGPHQLIPREEIRALSFSGNVPWGAFDGDELVGYVLGWAGVDEHGLHVHSHMLAALPERRHGGVGYALKMAQRAQALDQGITVVRWTFDPLVSRNAYFNLAKLGAVADAFHRDFYGEMTDDLNRGEATDRLVVRWDLEREASGPAEPAGEEVLGREGEPDLPRPTAVRAPSTAPALVRIPREYQPIRGRDPALADAWRLAVRAAIEACFDAGLVAVGYTREASYVIGQERP
jgi:predicted GNAT superfamily acetyltransferase